MKATGVSSNWGRLLGRAVLGYVAVAALAGVGSWLLGWRSYTGFGDAMVMVGIFVVIVSLFGVFSGMGEVSHGQYVMGNMPLPDALRERTRFRDFEVPPGKLLAIAYGLSGAAAAVTGLLLKTVRGA